MQLQWRVVSPVSPEIRGEDNTTFVTDTDEDGGARMPGIYHTPMSRKRFLATSLAMAGGAIAPDFASADEQHSSETARIALLSDTHIPAAAGERYRGFDPVENLKKILPHVVASRPVTAVINGDAARLVGAVDDYQHLRRLLTPLADISPVYIGLGNHDDRRNFFQIFDTAKADGTVNGKHVVVFERVGIRFVVLDSLYHVNEGAGFLGKTQRDWLARYLNDSDDRPVVVFVHHTLGDGDGDLLDVERMFGILERHEKVKALFYGHSHQFSFRNRRHIHLVNLPAVGYNFNDGEPVGWVDAVFSAGGVELTLHAFGGNQTKDGQTTVLKWA